MSAIWKDEKGNVISIEAIKDALKAARSVILKEIKFNRGIAEDPRMKVTYERHYEILGKLLGAYENAQKKTIKTKSIKKKRRKK